MPTPARRAGLLPLLMVGAAAPVPGAPLAEFDASFAGLPPAALARASREAAADPAIRRLAHVGSHHRTGWTRSCSRAAWGRTPPRSVGAVWRACAFWAWPAIRTEIRGGRGDREIDSDGAAVPTLIVEARGDLEIARQVREVAVGDSVRPASAGGSGKSQ